MWWRHAASRSPLLKGAPLGRLTDVGLIVTDRCRCWSELMTQSNSQAYCFCVQRWLLCWQWSLVSAERKRAVVLVNHFHFTLTCWWYRVFSVQQYIIIYVCVCVSWYRGDHWWVLVIFWQFINMLLCRYRYSTRAVNLDAATITTYDRYNNELRLFVYQILWQILVSINYALIACHPRRTILTASISQQAAQWFAALSGFVMVKRPRIMMARIRMARTHMLQHPFLR